MLYIIITNIYGSLTPPSRLNVIVVFMLLLLTAGNPAAGGMIYSGTGQVAAWPDMPTIVSFSDPANAMIAEGFNSGRYVLAQSFKVPDGKNMALDKIALVVNSGIWTISDFRLQDIGIVASPPATYTAGIDLLPLTSWISPAQTLNIGIFDFDNIDTADGITLQAGRTYSFELVSDTLNGTFWVYRKGGDPYADGRAYDALSFDGNRDWLPSGSRDFAMAVYLIPQFTWESSEIDNLWTNPQNWAGGVVPDGAINDSLYFGSRDIGDRIITNVDGFYTGVSSIDFSGALGSYSLSGLGGFFIDSGGSVGGDSGFAHTINVNLISNGPGGIQFNGQDDLTIEAIISAWLDGGITKSQDSTLTLSGQNTYTGGTALSAGTIILGNDSALGSGQLSVTGNSRIQSDNDNRTISNDIDIIDDTALTVSGKNHLTLSGIISGAGALIKTGASILTLSGKNTYTSTTTVSEGTLDLSGELCGDVIVDGGIFTGTGIITGDILFSLNSGGVFAPGSSIGISNIVGDYIQYSGSTLEIEVFKSLDGTLSSDLVDVTGSAVLEEDCIISVIDITPGDRLIGTGDKFTIITAGEGIVDNGALINSASPILRFDGSIVGNDYILTAFRNAFSDYGIGANNIAVLGAIDMDIGLATGDYITVINELTSLDPAMLNIAAGQLSPIAYVSTAAYNVQLIKELNSDMAVYLASRRKNEKKFSGFEFNSQKNLFLADSSNNPDILAYVISENQKCPDPKSVSDNELNYFIKPLGIFFSHDSSGKFVGFQAQAVGAEFGIDRIFGDNWIFGIGGSYARSYLKFDKRLGQADIDSFRAGPYASYFNGKFFLDASVSFGYHFNKMSREIAFGGIDRTAEGDYDAYDISAYIGTGYEFDLGKWKLTPSASLQYTSYRNKSFKEADAGSIGLDIDSQTQDSLFSRFGLKLNTTAQVGGIKVSPEIFAGYCKEFTNEKKIDARFIGGVTKFSNDVNINHGESFYYGAGLNAQLKENISAYIRYEGQAYSGNNSNTFLMGLAVKF